MKKKIKSSETVFEVKVNVTKNEPQDSIAMGYPGLGGNRGKTKFVTTIDMGGRGMLVSYTKPNGVSGCYKIDFLPIIQAAFDGGSK